MGPFFQNFQVFAMSMLENCEKWAHILRKIPQNGYLFLPKWPIKIGRGFEAWVAHPVQTKFEYPLVKTRLQNFQRSPKQWPWCSCQGLHIGFEMTALKNQILRPSENTLKINQYTKDMWFYLHSFPQILHLTTGTPQTHQCTTYQAYGWSTRHGTAS